MEETTSPHYVDPKGIVVVSALTQIQTPAKSESMPNSLVIPDKGLPFVRYKAWHEPVDPASLFNEISSTIRRFIILDQDQADTATLWVVHTYLTDTFDTSPIAIIDAPERACAKSLFQTILAAMSYKALSASNATPSSLFRSVDKWSTSIFFDEADTFFKDNSEMHGMINAGYKKNGFVLRTETVGETYTPRQYSVYGAKSIAGINLERHLPDATWSRGIVFKMRRKLSHETVERMRYAEPKLFEILASKLMRFRKDYETSIQSTRTTLPEKLSDRAQDNWEPLLIIAKCAGDEWLQRATDAALKLSSISKETVSIGNELLGDIQNIFELQKNQAHSDRISTVELITALTNIDDGPWKTYNHGHPLSPRQLAKQLEAYGIKPKSIRTGPYNSPKGYMLDQFADAFHRYLQPSGKAAEDEPANAAPASPPLQAHEIINYQGV